VRSSSGFEISVGREKKEGRGSGGARRGECAGWGWGNSEEGERRDTEEDKDKEKDVEVAEKERGDWGRVCLFVCGVSGGWGRRWWWWRE